jgi:3-phosphoshikimate 1-carboxyvinyltransferase
MRGGALHLPGGASSQFASALLLVGARLAGGLDLTVVPPAVSLPYVRLSEGVLRAFGVEVETPSELRWRVRPGEFRGRDYRVEGDHSSASYSRRRGHHRGGVRVLNLDPESVQLDAWLRSSRLTRLRGTNRSGLDRGGGIERFPAST